jgi:Protein of unknown function (DUF1236)
MNTYLRAALLTALLTTAACSQPKSPVSAQAPTPAPASTTSTAATPPATTTTAANAAATTTPPSPSAVAANTAAPPTASKAISLSADDAAKLKAWITAQDTASANLPGKAVVGSTMPLEVALHPIPASVGVPAAGASEYGIISDQIVLVDPNNYLILYVFK